MITEALTTAQSSERTRRLLWLVFLGAVAIRWGYDIVLFVTMGRNGLMGADFHGYLADAQTMAAAALNGTLHGWAWLGADPGVMPLYPWFLSANVALFGQLAPLTAAMAQGALDGGTCLLVYALARSIDGRIALPAAVAAAINPTQIVTSGLLYNDTIFAFWVALSLAGAAWWLRKPTWPAAFAMGIGLGVAAFDRIVVAPWVPVMIIVLLSAARLMGRLYARQVGQVAAMAAIFVLFIAPILTRNVMQYGAWSLTNQGGAHLALWVAPLVLQAKNGTPWQKGSAAMQKRVRERFGPKSSNPFISSQHYAEVGGEELEKLGVGAIAKAWFIGAAINLASPAILISPPIAQLPRTGFYATKGKSIMAKIGNFLFHSDNAAYAWALLIGIAGVVAIRLIQLGGLVTLAWDRNTWPILIFLMFWCGFILAANGPVASPKYRLPIEPVLCVLTGAGVVLLRKYGRHASA